MDLEEEYEILLTRLDDSERQNERLLNKIKSLEAQLAAAASYTEGVPVESDAVNSPDHYTAGGIETIDIIRAKLTPEEFAGYCKGNVIKYVTRARYKGGLEDLRKAGKYIEFATKEVERE